MKTIKLNINDSIYNEVINLLSKYNKEDIEIISEDLKNSEIKKYLDNELEDIDSGNASFMSADEVDNILNDTLNKYGTSV